MQFVDTRYEHSVADDNGVPHIAGTTMHVVELARHTRLIDGSAQELHFQFP